MHLRKECLENHLLMMSYKYRYIRTSLLVKLLAALDHLHMHKYAPASFNIVLVLSANAQIIYELIPTATTASMKLNFIYWTRLKSFLCIMVHKFTLEMG